MIKKFSIGDTPTLLFVNYDTDELSNRDAEFKDLIDVYPSYPAEIVFKEDQVNTSKVEELLGKIVINHKNEKVDINKHFAGKTLGIYFSAHWCGPCRGFTPVLTDFYKNHHEAKNFEIVFFSSDSNQQSFKEYFEEMPWLALPYNKQARVVRFY